MNKNLFTKLQGITKRRPPLWNPQFLELCIWSVALPFADYVDSVHLYETPKKVSRRPIRSLFRGLARARKKYAQLRTVDNVLGSTKVSNVVELWKTLLMEKRQACVPDGIS